MSTEGKINIQLITAAVLLGIFSGLSTAETIYVDSSASGANDGSSWTDAFNFLQDGLSGAEYDDEIRVAEGIYYPSVKVGGTSDRNKTFQLINGVAIYGGFPSGGGTWADRDSDQYETILSGDIDGDDIIDPNKTENSYHVFYHPEGLALEPNAVLDGFTITAGNANLDSVPHRYGGGMLNWDYNSPTVTGCTFTGNSAYWVGGGMCNSKSSPAVTNCTFIGNSTEYLDGGGMFNNQSNPIVTNCSFTGNSAVRLGGGMHNDESSPAVTDCTFIGNLANKGGGGMCNSENSPTVTNCTFGSNSVEGENSRGGGMLNYTYSSPEVSHCTFSGNSADDGGGMANDSYSSPTVTDCTFTGNEAGSDGGGMYNEDSNPTATNCNFTGNSAYYGGGMKNWRSNSIVVNCTFSGNSANLHGGGMYNRGSSTVTNCTFSGNRADEGSGGGIYIYWFSVPVLTNCILWGNTASSGGNEIALTESSAIDVDYSDIAGAQAGIYDDGSGNTINWGTGNIDADPCFVDPGYWDESGTSQDPDDDIWVDGNYHLLPGSPCIDAGDNTPVTSITDLDGRGRIANGTVDMGPYEFQTIVIHVDAAAPPGGDGTSWATAYNYLQDGLSAAWYGDEIWVAEGTYMPDANSSYPEGTGDQEATFQLKTGVGLYGGFPSGGGTWPVRDPNRYETILSGDLDENDEPVTHPRFLLGHISRYENSYIVVNSSSTAGETILDGFTITAANNSGGLFSPHGSGSAIYNQGGNPVIANCRLVRNAAENSGGAIGNFRIPRPHSGDTSITLTNCVITENSAHRRGGGIANTNGTVTLTGCTFTNNWVYYWGGALFGIGDYYLYSSRFEATSCIFTANSAGDRGGAIYWGDWEYENNNEMVLTDCTFTENSVLDALDSGNGGGISAEGISSVIMTNCTFIDNSAQEGNGGGFCNSNSEYSSITDCTFIGNWADSGAGVYNLSSSPEITNCIFSNNLANVAGGGMMNFEHSSPTVINCTFVGNRASNENARRYEGWGGAMINSYESHPIVTNCTFKNNIAAESGGGICNSGNTTVTRCEFTGNSAEYGGGMYNSWEGSPAITNCIFTGNYAHAGGALDNYGAFFPYIANCTFAGNRATYGDVLSYNDCRIELTNCIIWNGFNPICHGWYFEGGCWPNGRTKVSYSNVEGGWEGEGNIDSDPCFVDPGWWDPNGTPDITSDDIWVEGDYHLKWLSPCFNAGDPNDGDYFGQTDMDGRARVRYGRVDMGADEIFPLGCDFEPDDDVDLADFTSFGAAWSVTDCNKAADFNGDCLVDISDLLIFAEYWLEGAGETISMLDNLWMYQTVYIPKSNLTASAWVIDDPLANSSYTYDWEMVLPDDVTVAPFTLSGGGPDDISWTFGAPFCTEPNGISDSGQPFTVKVTVTGNDYGNIIMAEAQFGIALLGDVNNDGVVNIADRSIINAFWRTGAAGSFSLRDCDLNCDGVVNVADRSIVNSVWRGVFGQNSVSNPCPYR